MFRSCTDILHLLHLVDLYINLTCIEKISYYSFLDKRYLVHALNSTIGTYALSDFFIDVRLKEFPIFELFFCPSIIEKK